MGVDPPTTTTPAGANGTTNGTAPSSTGVPSQAGVLTGGNPSVWSASSPITLFIIQAFIIIVFCRLLHWPLSRLRQPRVIAEVIGGIILGPSILGRIPGFSDAIFPAPSIPSLNLVANLGLVLFLFLVGLEVDLRFLMSNWKVALSVGAAGMALPFGLGAAIAWGLYNQFPTAHPISFGVYLLFIGVAMAITAFPVLCRILTELKLLRTPVGIVVLSAGVGNDVVGWILLALCVALVNAGTGLTALWVLLVAVGYTLFLAFAIRPAFLWILRRAGSLQNGPSQGMVALTLLLVLASSWFTNIIGIHAIFGAFMVGLICPHEGGFAIKLTEKIEDLVCAILLPLYFALSGLSTNLGLLDTGITWAYVIGVLCIAFFAKVTGGALAARCAGLVWRESLTIGALMSCKGLVELIVLNIGLQAGILSTRTFTIFVVMALLTTFATTPLVSALYPPWYQTKLEAWKRGDIDWEGNRLTGPGSGSSDDGSVSTDKSKEVTRLLTNLRLDSMAGVLGLVSLLVKPSSSTSVVVHPSKKQEKSDDSTEMRQRPFQVHGVRLAALTERSSSVMRVTEIEEYGQRDPVLNTFRTFGQISNVAVSGIVALGPEADYASTLAERARDVSADLMLLPWSETGGMSELPVTTSKQDSHHHQGRFANGVFSHFLTEAVARPPCDVAVFVDCGFGSKRLRVPRTLQRSLSALSIRSLEQSDATRPTVEQGHHIFLPYFGTADDRAALRLVLQLAKESTVTATIVHFELSEQVLAQAADSLSPTTPHSHAMPTAPGSASTPSAEVKNGTMTTTATAVPASPAALASFTSARESLSPELADRVEFATVDCTGAAAESTSAASFAVARAVEELGHNPKNAGDLLVLGRNASLAATHGLELAEGHDWSATDAGVVLGVVAGGLVRAGTRASILVLQAGSS